MDLAPAPPIGQRRCRIDPPTRSSTDTIDLGVVALEFLTLALDFYPKKPGVAF